jgi:hypothetical protein
MRRERRSAPAAGSLEELVEGMRWRTRGRVLPRSTAVHMAVRMATCPEPLPHPRSRDSGRAHRGARPRPSTSPRRPSSTRRRPARRRRRHRGLPDQLGFVDGAASGCASTSRDYHGEAASSPWPRTWPLPASGDVQREDVRRAPARRALPAEPPASRWPRSRLRPAAPRAATLEGPLESCRLRSLEVELLRLTRVGDVPGEQIRRSLDFVRRRDARALARVFEHNRQDTCRCSLAVLACQWVEEGGRRTRDVLASPVLSGAALRAVDAEYRRLSLLDPGPLGAALMPAARASAPAITSRPPSGGRRSQGCGSPSELAVHHEHRSRRPRSTPWSARCGAGRRDDDFRAAAGRGLRPPADGSSGSRVVAYPSRTDSGSRESASQARSSGTRAFLDDW